MSAIAVPPSTDREDPSAWRALWALALGFFILLVDTTIVSVSVPAIMSDLKAGVAQVVWVSSAYLLTYAVPLMIMGRMGDRFSPKRVYLVGLAIFTLSSLWCGLAPSITSLIVARGVQGLGAAMMSPQTMAVITRLFPPARRGAPMGLWGATAGVAGLVGPILGGLLTDGVGWRWIFFVNVPIGIVAFVLTMRLVPDFEPHQHQWDWLGVALNAVGLFCVVFALEEGQANHWAAWIWVMLVAGLALLAGFGWWQRVNTREPLMPFDLFEGRNFLTASVGVFVLGLTVVAMSFPFMLFLQTARGLTPTQAALLSIPSAVASVALAPVVGKIVDRRDPKPLIIAGFLVFVAALVLELVLMRTSGSSVLWMLVPSLLLGVSGSMLWGPLSNAATRDLPVRLAGAGSGVYNAARQLGSVLGSAAIAAVMEWQLGRQMPSGGGSAQRGGAVGQRLPELLQAPFSTAMANAMLLPVAATVVGLLVAFALKHRGADRTQAPAPESTPAA